MPETATLQLPTLEASTVAVIAPFAVPPVTVITSVGAGTA